MEQTFASTAKNCELAKVGVIAVNTVQYWNLFCGQTGRQISIYMSILDNNPHKCWKQKLANIGLVVTFNPGKVVFSSRSKQRACIWLDASPEKMIQLTIRERRKRRRIHEIFQYITAMSWFTSTLGCESIVYNNDKWRTPSNSYVLLMFSFFNRVFYVHIKNFTASLFSWQFNLNCLQF